MERRDMLKGAISAAAALAATETPETKSEITGEFYAVVELLGYRKLCGLVSQGPMGMFRIQVAVDGGFITQLFNAASAYRITVVDEKTCRAYASSVENPLPPLELLPEIQTRLNFRDEADEYNQEWHG